MNKEEIRTLKVILYFLSVRERCKMHILNFSSHFIMEGKIQIQGHAWHTTVVKQMKHLGDDF